MPLAEYLHRDHFRAFKKRIVEATLTTPGLKLATNAGFHIERSQFEVYLPLYMIEFSGDTFNEIFSI
jgi:hypothetical protein